MQCDQALQRTGGVERTANAGRSHLKLPVWTVHRAAAIIDDEPCFRGTPEL